MDKVLDTFNEALIQVIKSLDEMVIVNMPVEPFENLLLELMEIAWAGNEEAANVYAKFVQHAPPDMKRRLMVRSGISKEVKQ